MDSLLTTQLSRHPLQVLPETLAPEEVTQHKLSRLLELRAVIDAMRHERESRDPLMAWARGRERP